MTTVILLRHGRTSANTEGVLAGDAPVQLDETGVQQASAAGTRLAGLPLRAVITSPLLRCRETLGIALPNVNPAVEPGLTECGYGEWAGRKLSELSTELLWSTVQHHPSAVTFPGGEAMAAMSARAIAAVRRWNAIVADEHGPEAAWLACTHGDVIKAIVADALGVHLDGFQRIHVAPGSLTVIKYTQDRPFVLRLSDDSNPLLPGGTSSDAAVGGGAV
ncbi:MSMEG_4193 family putative phosphomutase [Catelliglobosispora koreensis]|uniref:MSMEG_4193 family putative phosphomutase n=1 Tax=Catelliglobosispora koreensis TaxID=129052 RepID=UPI000371ABC5|nr:MSMEG_4193 family putative phosphomutase [Catelliglobosispora koreensis]